MLVQYGVRRFRWFRQRTRFEVIKIKRIGIVSSVGMLKINVEREERFGVRTGVGREKRS